MELFDLPPTPTERLAPGLQEAVFGDLPTSLARDLHTPEVGDLVLQLLDNGWRPGQVADRVGRLPAGRDPVVEITGLLQVLLTEQSPDARWREERSQRQRARPVDPEPASPASRAQWIAQIRRDLGAPRSSRREPPVRLRPPCALCEGQSSYFVTREVRLCEGCVVLLGTGALSLPDAG